jgi:hypothetical protein
MESPEPTLMDHYGTDDRDDHADQPLKKGGNANCLCHTGDLLTPIIPQRSSPTAVWSPNLSLLRYPHPASCLAPDPLGQHSVLFCQRIAASVYFTIMAKLGCAERNGNC